MLSRFEYMWQQVYTFINIASVLFSQRLIYHFRVEMKNKSITRDKVVITQEQADHLYHLLDTSIKDQLELIRQDFLNEVKNYLEVWLHPQDDLDDVQPENMQNNESKIAMDV